MFHVFMFSCFMFSCFMFHVSATTPLAPTTDVANDIHRYANPSLHPRHPRLGPLARRPGHSFLDSGNPLPLRPHHRNPDRATGFSNVGTLPTRPRRVPPGHHLRPALAYQIHPEQRALCPVRAQRPWRFSLTDPPHQKNGSPPCSGTLFIHRVQATPPALQH